MNVVVFFLNKNYVVFFYLYYLKLKILIGGKVMLLVIEFFGILNFW